MAENNIEMDKILLKLTNGSIPAIAAIDWGKKYPVALKYYNKSEPAIAPLICDCQNLRWHLVLKFTGQHLSIKNVQRKLHSRKNRFTNDPTYLLQIFSNKATSHTGYSL